MSRSLTPTARLAPFAFVERARLDEPTVEGMSVVEQRMWQAAQLLVPALLGVARTLFGQRLF